MLNSTNLVGRLTKDVELRYTPSNQAVATFTLAVNRDFKNQNGEREADFINCVIWRQQAENFANFVKKGHLVSITGRIQTRNYEDNDGKRVYVTEVVAEKFSLLEKRENQGNAGNQNNQFGNQQPRNFGNQQNAFGNSNPIDINDSDLPF